MLQCLIDFFSFESCDSNPESWDSNWTYGSFAVSARTPIVTIGFNTIHPWLGRWDKGFLHMGMGWSWKRGTKTPNQLVLSRFKIIQASCVGKEDDFYLHCSSRNILAAARFCHDVFQSVSGTVEQIAINGLIKFPDFLTKKTLCLIMCGSKTHKTTVQNWFDA